MKRCLCITIAVLAAACLVPSASLAYTYTSTGTSYPLIVVDNTPGDQSQPHVSGRYASYNVTSSLGANTIGYFDFLTQTKGTVPQPSNAIDNLSDVFGNTIVFTRIDVIKADSSIMSYPIGGTPSEVAPVAPPGLPQRSNPSIGGSTIAWEDVGVTAAMNSEIVVESAGSVTQLTNNGLANLNPRVSADGSTVVWETCTNVCDVYAAVKSGSSWSVSPIATTAANETSPDTNGSLIAYASTSATGGYSNIHFRPLSGGVDQAIPLPSGVVDANHPSIAGDFIAFEARNFQSESDIWVYNVTDGSLRQITDTPQDSEFLADVSVSTSAGVSTVTVVWEVSVAATGTGEDVYATRFNEQAIEIFTDRAKFLQAAGTVSDVNFDETACGATINAPVAASTEYANLGLTFSLGAIAPSAAAQSSPNVILGLGSGTGGIGTTLPPLEIRGSFAQPVSAIGFTNVGPGADLSVADAAGNILTQASTDTDPSTADFLGVVSTSPIISSFRLSGPNLAADDLVFTSIATPDCTPPVLTLPGPIVVPATSPSGAAVSYVVTATDDIDPSPRVDCLPASGSVFPIGTTLVGCTATDASNNVTTAGFAVTVTGAPGELSDLTALVQSLNLQQGITNSLDAKLANAQAALAAARAGDLVSACSLLNAFINEVQAQNGNKITAAQVSKLIAAANQIKAVLGCP